MNDEKFYGLLHKWYCRMDRVPAPHRWGMHMVGNQIMDGDNLVEYMSIRGHRPNKWWPKFVVGCTTIWRRRR